MMTLRAASRLFRSAPVVLFLFWMSPLAQPSSAQALAGDAKLQLVIVLSRHGVRSPLTSQADLDKYSAAPWPTWDVAPGLLTAHGYQLMKLFGAWDRSGSPPTACSHPPAARTRPTSRSLPISTSAPAKPAKLSPRECFRIATSKFIPGQMAYPIPFSALEKRALAILIQRLLRPRSSGRIGGDPANLTETYRPQLAALDRVLAGCGRLPAKSASHLDLRHSCESHSPEQAIPPCRCAARSSLLPRWPKICSSSTRRA